VASFNRYEIFSQKLAEKIHDLNADQLMLALTNTAPNLATHDELADITEIGGGNGYTAGGADTQNATSRSGAVTSVTGVDITWTASGGTIGPFRYAVLYNTTPTGDPLIGYWDYGSSITLQNGEQFVADFGSSLFTVG
jgi:hypothetical protein